MSYTYTRTFETFKASELAPQVEEFRKLQTNDTEKILIGNQFGNIVLKITKLGSGIKLDETVEPPVIRFDFAEVASEFGYTNANGDFRKFDNPLGYRLAIVNGTYRGPSSEFQIA